MIVHSQNKTADAKKRYEAIVNADPTAAVAANNLAWIYQEENDRLDDALRLAQGAAARLPDSAEVQDTIGMIYFKKELPALAVAAFEKAHREAARQPRLSLPPRAGAEGLGRPAARAGGGPAGDQAEARLRRRAEAAAPRPRGDPDRPCVFTLARRLAGRAAGARRGLHQLRHREAALSRERQAPRRREAVRRGDPRVPQRPPDRRQVRRGARAAGRGARRAGNPERRLSRVPARRRPAARRRRRPEAGRHAPLHGRPVRGRPHARRRRC